MTYTLSDIARTQPAARCTEIFSSGARTPALLASYGASSSQPASVEHARPSITVTESHEGALPLVEWRNFDWDPIANTLCSFLTGGLTVRMHILATDASLPFSGRGPNIVTPSKALNEIASAFGLSTTQLAEVARTSRQTVYDWRRGQQIRSAARARLDQLAALAQEWKKLSSAPVGEALDYRDSSTGHSLLDLLRAEPLHEAAVVAYLQRLHEHLEATWAAADADIADLRRRRKTAIPEDWREHTLRSISGRSRSP